MDLTSVIIWLIVGLIAGFLAGQVMKGGGYGVVGDIVVGIIGALIGGFLSTSLGGPAPSGLNVVSIIIAFIGAVILIAILRAVGRGRAGV